MPPVNDWVNVAAVRSELPVIRSQASQTPWKTSPMKSLGLLKPLTHFASVAAAGFAATISFALSLESCHFLASANQQVAIKDELGFVANRAVAWDDNHRVRDFRYIRLGSADHAVDAAARRIIDEGIVAVPERVTDVENIGVRKVNGDIAVGVGGGVVLEGNRRPIELHSPLIIKDFCRNCSWWRWREGEVPALHSSGVGEALSCVRVSENECTLGVQPFVAIGVVKVPVGVDQLLDRVGA